MAIHYRSHGIVIKKEDRGEADQVFTIYTKDFGKLEVLGKAIRKIKSKLRPGTELFYLSEIEFIQGKTYKTLTDVFLIEKFGNLRENLGKLKISYRIADILDNLVRGQEKDEKIWNLLNTALKELNTNNLKFKTYNLIYYYFIWKLFSLLGYSPQLYNCVICQKKLVLGKLYFSSEEGGVICQACFKKIKKGKEILPEVIKILRFLLEKDWAQTKKLRIDSTQLKSLKAISDNYLTSLPKLIISQP